jgi:UDP-GlcNAc:undecaprenyl-phosphate GlcNAc-1-phosphate transferase
MPAAGAGCEFFAAWQRVKPHAFAGAGKFSHAADVCYKVLPERGMFYSLIFFIFGFLIALCATPWTISLARKGFGLDPSNETRKRHEGEIPRIGGLPIILALVGGLLNILWLEPSSWAEWTPVLLGSVLMFSLGLLDDVRSLQARWKFAGQIAIASMVYFMGLRIEQMTYPGGAWIVPLGLWGYPITVFWLIAVPNIINLIDGFDGLAGGLGLFMAVTLGIVGLLNEQLPVAYFAFVMAGALLGFLTFNFPPAKIFLGDGGAYLIGFSIAALSLTSSNKGSIGAVLLVTVVALGIPILDTTFAMTRRAFRGFPLFAADDEHIHHRLESLGFSKRRIVLSLYGLCVVLSIMALSIVWSQGRTIPIAIGAIVLLAIFGVRYLRYVKTFGEIPSQVERVLERRRGVQYALLQAQVLMMELDRCKGAEEFWKIFDETMLRVGFIPESAILSDQWVAIRVKYSTGEPWTLLAPSSYGTSAEWQRIAETFRPVYSKAKEKWPR